MLSEETSHPQTEITRLNQIITVLLEQNNLLKRENAYLKTRMGLPQAGDSYAKTSMGKSDVSYPYPESGIGLSGEWKSHVETDMEKGENTKSYAETDMGKEEAANANAKTGIGKSTELKPLPDKLPTDEWNVKKLAGRLSIVGISNMKRSGRINVAKLFIHFYNKGGGGYNELQKATGLSEGGIGKLMMSLKKRGLVHRTAYRQFGLSAGVMNLLQTAFQKLEDGPPKKFDWFSKSKEAFDEK